MLYPHANRYSKVAGTIAWHGHYVCTLLADELKIFLKQANSKLGNHLLGKDVSFVKIMSTHTRIAGLSPFLAVNTPPFTQKSA
ncbi:MAG: hypothetical protein F6J95_004530 [Leptolyngbya sp. SIO1E4]|nr:hypothetical protein [Leptolyngbya sp. SIO1E4]